MKNSKFDLPIKLKKSSVIFLCIFSLGVYFISLIFPYIFKSILDNVGNTVGNYIYTYLG